MIDNNDGDADDDGDWHLAGLSLLWTPPAPQEAEQAPQDSHSPLIVIIIEIIIVIIITIIIIVCNFSYNV